MVKNNKQVYVPKNFQQLNNLWSTAKVSALILKTHLSVIKINIFCDRRKGFVAPTGAMTFTRPH